MNKKIKNLNKCIIKVIKYEHKIVIYWKTYDDMSNKEQNVIKIYPWCVFTFIPFCMPKIICFLLESESTDFELCFQRIIRGNLQITSRFRWGVRLKNLTKTKFSLFLKSLFAYVIYENPNLNWLYVAFVLNIKSCL